MNFSQAVMTPKWTTCKCSYTTACWSWQFSIYSYCRHVLRLKLISNKVHRQSSQCRLLV